MARREIGTRWDRENRNNINENFKELYDVQDRAIEEATQSIIDSAKLIWLEPVNTYTDIATTYPNPEIGHTVFVRDTGKVYRFYDGAWMEIQQIDAGPVNEVDTRLSAEIEENRQEIEQARTKADGTTFPFLRDRLNDVDATLINGGIDRLVATSKFLTTLPSYIGLLNVAYVDDNGTRFYILPKDKVITGVGGCIKIFGDAYHLGQDYRDFGIYFHADQNGENGYHGNGVFWFNVKVLDNGIYADKHPDLGISFQDGQVVWGRWIYLPNGTKRSVLMIGSNDPMHALSNTEIGIELSKAIALQHTQKIFLYTDDPSIANSVRSQGKKVLWSLATGGGEEKYIAGVKKTDLTEQKFEVLNALTTTSRRDVTTDTSTLNANGVNRIVINQPNANTITSITGGVDGQELMIINVAGNSTPQKTTIEHNTSIKLKGGTNYGMGYNHVLTLINVNGTWYEKCRSENA